MSTLSAFVVLKIGIAEIAKIGGVIILFVGPEKAAAFFGPVLKRKQEKE